MWWVLWRQRNREVALVIAVGLDKGKKEALEMTVVIANPQVFAAGEGGGGGNMEPFFITSVEGPTIWECYTLMNTYVTREISFHHTNAYFIGEELARDGIKPYLLGLIRHREVRRDSYMYIANGRVKDFLTENKPILEIFPGKVFHLIGILSQRTGFYSTVDMHQFYLTLNNLHSSPTLPLVGINTPEGQGTDKDASESLRAPYLAGEVPREGGNKVEFAGAAIFNNDKMVGRLTADENRTMMILQGCLTAPTLVFRIRSIRIK
nr:hypothetical protein [Desulforamulus aquiferis]